MKSLHNCKPFPRTRRKSQKGLPELEVCPPVHRTSMEVHAACKKLLKPSTPTPSHLRKFELSSFDQLKPTFYVPIIFHYRATSGVGRVRRLEESLSQTLSIFYHLAGRYGEDGTAIDCYDQGIVFVEARVDGKLDQLLLDGGADCSETLLALPGSSAVVAGSSLPLVAVQVNVFECGGLAVSVQINHIVGDMYSMCVFMNSWAAKCRRVMDVVEDKIKVEVDRPDFDLARLFPPREDLGKVFQSSFVSEDQVVISLGRRDLTSKRFLFKNEGLSRLRAETTTGTGSELCMKHGPSRVVLLTALLCRVLMRIDRARSGRSRPMAVDQMLNLRGRTSLPVREDVFGNFYVDVATAPFTTDKDPELVDRVGTALRNAIAEFGEVVDREELAQKAEARVKQAYEMVSKGEVTVVTVSSWCRFPLYGVDYGWGRPSLVSTMKSTLDRVVFFVDAEKGDGIDAWVTLEDDHMTDFERDPDILRYAFRS